MCYKTKFIFTKDDKQIVKISQKKIEKKKSILNYKSTPLNEKKFEEN